MKPTLQATVLGNWLVEKTDCHRDQGFCWLVAKGIFLSRMILVFLMLGMQLCKHK